MKEILFRGKCKDSDEWVYGGIVHQTDYYGDKVDKWFIIDGTDTMDYDIGSNVEVIPETVGQFTGLTDKNGKKIFEGDIVRYCDEDYYYYPEECTKFLGRVVQECGTFGIDAHNELPLELGNWCDNAYFVSLRKIYWTLNCCGRKVPTIEVIGNIPDNKELQKMTNEERIKSMSVRDLANFLHERMSSCGDCPICETCGADYRYCLRNLERWLKSEVEE